MDDTPNTPDTALTRAFRAQRDAALRDPMPTHARRIAMLDALDAAVRRHEQDWVDAISADFGHRAPFETRLLEWMPLLTEIAHLRRHLKRWMRPRRVAPNWNFLPGRAQLYPQPRGLVGVIGAWNYPLLLNLSPAVNAIAAGNRVMIKPSEHAPATAALMQRVIAECFTADEVVVVMGDAELSAAFAALPFDHIVFTGSGRVGRKVMAAAAANLTPVTLELGGKSPAIVHDSFNLEDAADRIASAKFWNAGQTCIAPDYALVPRAKIDTFANHAMATINRRWPPASRADDYTRMIDAKARARMQSLVDDAAAQGARILQAWAPDDARGYPPTLLLDVHPDMQVMQEEIFGPLLPVIGYDTLDDALGFVRERDRPLALYYFDHDAGRIDHVLATTHAGGVTVNDCMVHFAQHRLPFGGIGGSGFGAYHGEAGFNALSHFKPVLRQSTLTARLLGRLAKPPYGPDSYRLLRLLVGRGRAG